MLRVTYAASRYEGLANLAVRYGDYKLAEKIVCLLAKQKAGKEQKPLSQKERPVKPLPL
jgi:hypothetical protein